MAHLALDRTQRIAGTMALLFAAYFVGHTVHRYNQQRLAVSPVSRPSALPVGPPESSEGYSTKSSAKSDELQKGPAKGQASLDRWKTRKRQIEVPVASKVEHPGKSAVSINQQSSGANSPNIVGSNNQFTFNADPPRRLSQFQIDAIRSSAASLCSTAGTINVTAANGNPEAQRYAYDFVLALRSGGCKAELALPIPGLTPDVVGVIVGVRNAAAVDLSARALGRALSSAGIAFSVNSLKDDFFPTEQFVLVVGAKN
jgi:hypothetical protein